MQAKYLSTSTDDAVAPVCEFEFASMLLAAPLEMSMGVLMYFYAGG